MNLQQFRQMLRLAVGAVLLAAVAAPLASAESVKIVVPNRLDGVEGEDSSIVLSNVGSFRQQQLNLASEFASLPGTHRTITGLYTRPDFTVVQPSSASYADLVIKVSTTPVSGLSSVFANNYGAEVTTVFDGPLTISTQATGPLEGPRGFDYYFPFETPYTYDPDAGNLLVETVSNSGPSGPPGSLIFDTFRSTSPLYVASLPISSSGNVQNGGFVNQFEFVPQGQVLHETLMHAGIERNYILYVPSTYSAGEATPLVLNLHGRFGNADQQMTTSAMNAVAEEEGFLVAYPNSIDDSWDLDADGDVRFIDELLGMLGSQYTVDTSRVYSTGFSAGGILSYVLAVTRPDTFAAIAPVAGFRRIDSEQDGSGLFPSWAPRVPPRPFPLMHVHGTADLTVPYDGGTGILGGLPFPSLEETLDEWLACNGCDATPSLSELPDIMPDDESTVSVLSYGNCGTYLSADGEEILADVVHYRVNGGRHSWPVLEADRAASLAAMEATWGAVSLPYFLPLNSDFGASAAMWEFFEQHVVAVILLGDVNDDGEVNGLDVDPFVEVLLNGPFQPEADMNEDQVVNGLDVDAFVAAVVGGTQPIPEPSTLLLAFVALGVVGGWRNWGGCPPASHRPRGR